ncbi:zinc dependent phospholipase C family protein [Mucilaginibacter sp. dw_454]|uniref:zinc dependent phospholipase C family protein n=1 Tax=Mucilaginibacter sp. dw_454 TaxID=2720079 RepID=UPI001BD28189|nr:zinc dependent phospholipase C family protein [Mucilaginibacter sp. dw_454]
MPFQGKAYSVLTHEAIIDASWEKSLKPLIQKRYPGLSEADIRLAHSYAYGGSLMADIGYSPFGSEYFTNLIHYVRTGDFVNNLISESESANEFAYALGALCHYMADQYGHSLGTNVVVPMTYPDVKKKFGPVATYDEDHTAHSRVEIAFDVLQVARGNYASQAYHDFIGFNVAKPVLEKAFLKTYGQDINTIFPNLDRSINNFRWAINSLMPTVTRSAWVLKKDEIKKTEPGVTSRKFHYRMQRKKYYGEFGRDRDKIEFKQQLLAFFLKIVPKIGPFKVFKFKPISHEGEVIFIKSFDEVTRHYEEALAMLDYKKPHLPNVDFDTGVLTTYGEYGLATKTYNDLLDQLAQGKYVALTQQLKDNITQFYSKADTVSLAKNDTDSWKKRRLILQTIATENTVPVDSLHTTNKVNDKVFVIKLNH